MLNPTELLELLALTDVLVFQSDTSQKKSETRFDATLKSALNPLCIFPFMLESMLYHQRVFSFCTVVIPFADSKRILYGPFILTVVVEIR